MEQQRRGTHGGHRQPGNFSDRRPRTRTLWRTNRERTTSHVVCFSKLLFLYLKNYVQKLEFKNRPDNGFEWNGWEFGSYHGYHRPQITWKSDYRKVVDGALFCGGITSSLKIELAELIGVPEGSEKLQELVNLELEELCQKLFTDHFPVRMKTVLTLPKI